MLSFNETSLSNALAKLPSRLQSAFALSCTQRLSEAVRNCRDDSIVASGLVARFEVLLEALWQGAINGNSVGSAIEKSIEMLGTESPDEEDLAKAGCPYIEDAISALIYSSNSLNGEGERYACWAAMQAYAAVDDFVARTYFAEDIAVDSEAILRHELTQRELSRQLRDLELLRGAAQQTDKWLASCAQLRAVAYSETGMLFSL